MRNILHISIYVYVYKLFSIGANFCLILSILLSEKRYLLPEKNTGDLGHIVIFCPDKKILRVYTKNPDWTGTKSLSP